MSDPGMDPVLGRKKKKAIKDYQQFEQGRWIRYKLYTNSISWLYTMVCS